MWKSMDDEDGEEVSCQEQEKMLTPTVLVSRRRKILEVTRLPTMYCVKKCVQQAADVNKVFLDCRIGPTPSCLVAEQRLIIKLPTFLPQQQSPSLTLCLLNIHLLNLLHIPFHNIYPVSPYPSSTSTSSASPP